MHLICDRIIQWRTRKTHSLFLQTLSPDHTGFNMLGSNHTLSKANSLLAYQEDAEPLSTALPDHCVNADTGSESWLLGPFWVDFLGMNRSHPLSINSVSTTSQGFMHCGFLINWMKLTENCFKMYYCKENYIIKDKSFPITYSNENKTKQKVRICMLPSSGLNLLCVILLHRFLL